MNKFVKHPIYDLYECNKKGQYRHIENKNEMIGKLSTKGYFNCTVKSSDGKVKATSVHRLIWSCFNGEIPPKMEIDHINHDRTDNRLKNLRCVSVSENRKNRVIDMTKITQGNAQLLKKTIKATTLLDNKVFYFKSKNQCAQYFEVSPSLVFYYTKSGGICTTGKGEVKFESVDAMPEELKENEEKILIKDPRIGVVKVPLEVKKEKHNAAMKRYLDKKKAEKNALKKQQDI